MRAVERRDGRWDLFVEERAGQQHCFAALEWWLLESLTRHGREVVLERLGGGRSRLVGLVERADPGSSRVD